MDSMFVLYYVIGSYVLTWVLCVFFVRNRGWFKMDVTTAMWIFLLAPVVWLVPVVVLLVIMPREWLLNRISRNDADKWASWFFRERGR